jgi:hypothetical protein
MSQAMQRRPDDQEGLTHLDWVNEDLPRLGHENLIEHCRLSTRWGVDGQLHEAGGVMLFTTGSPVSINATGAFRIDPEIGGRSVLERADDFFGGTSCDYFVKVRDAGGDDDLRAASKEAGFISFDWEEPEMSCRTPVAELPLLPNVTLQTVTTAGRVKEFIQWTATPTPTRERPPRLWRPPSVNRAASCRALTWWRRSRMTRASPWPPDTCR